MLRLGTALALATALGCGDPGTEEAADANIGVPEFSVQNTDDSGVVHSFTFRCLDLTADAPQLFVSDGPHEHSIRLEVAQMQSVLAGDEVRVNFTEGHEHLFIITKPEEACLGLGSGGA